MARVTVGITTSGCTAVIPGILPPANLVTPDNGGNDWYYEFLLNGVNALGSGAVVRETVGFAVESDTVGNETRYIYPSPFWTSRPIYDLRSFSSIRFSMAAIQFSTGRGTSLATGSPYIVLQSSNGSRTITKDSPPPTSMDFQVLSAPILASGSGWTVTTDGDFQPAAVTSIRFGLRTVNPGFASGLANIQFVK